MNNKIIVFENINRSSNRLIKRYSKKGFKIYYFDGNCGRKIKTQLIPVKWKLYKNASYDWVNFYYSEKEYCNAFTNLDVLYNSDFLNSFLLKKCEGLYRHDDVVLFKKKYLLVLLTNYYIQKGFIVLSLLNYICYIRIIKSFR